MIMRANIDSEMPSNRRTYPVTIRFRQERMYDWHIRLRWHEDSLSTSLFKKANKTPVFKSRWRRLAPNWLGTQASVIRAHLHAVVAGDLIGDDLKVKSDDGISNVSVGDVQIEAARALQDLGSLISRDLVHQELRKAVRHDFMLGDSVAITYESFPTRGTRPPLELAWEAPSRDVKSGFYWGTRFVIARQTECDPNSLAPQTSPGLGQPAYQSKWLHVVGEGTAQGGDELQSLLTTPHRVLKNAKIRDKALVIENAPAPKKQGYVNWFTVSQFLQALKGTLIATIHCHCGGMDEHGLPYLQLGPIQPLSQGESQDIKMSEAVRSERVEALFNTYCVRPYSVRDIRLADGSLVLINACRAGEVGHHMFSRHEFADVFLKANASCVILPLAEVPSGAACGFLESLVHEALKKGRRVGDVLRRFKEGSSVPGMQFPLFYVLYGNPDLNLFGQLLVDRTT